MCEVTRGFAECRLTTSIAGGTEATINKYMHTAGAMAAAATGNKHN